ncbi:galactose-1-epimerase [Nocardioides sp. KIGAM211]|uniref:Galactose-1-epimerase n=1 Tax=Nocardioides luti TaxID=2761101 RepID=A0A7X0RGC6_9ACTN|nr:galactose-1-epimerase [Nocardioides luti]MBB6627786.1 galactose-1-epimerase [Nocardioides luti]
MTSVAQVEEPLRTGVRIASRDLVVDLSPRGARLVRMWARTSSGRWRDVLSGPADDEGYLASPSYAGATIGRVANRIAGGRLDIDGTAYELDRNDDGRTLHGGGDGFDRRTWQVVSTTSGCAVLRLESPDGDQGFPGRVVVTARFVVVGDRLGVRFRATTDRPTCVALTVHPYLHVADDPADARLWVPAAAWLPAAGKVPTGVVEPLDGHPADLRPGRSLADLVGATGGVDHTYAVDGTGMRPVARLRGRDVEVRMSSDQPGLHVYTAHDLPDTGGEPVRGVALEPGLYPDAVHHETWRSPVLRAPEVYVWNAMLRGGPARPLQLV